MDEYEDESGIDTGNSSGQTYDSVNDFYKNYSDIDSDTVLLLHLDNNVTDSEITPKTVTNNGVTFSSSEKKFGSHSGYFNSTYLTVPDSADWYFGTGDFTIDAWIYPSSIETTVKGIVSQTLEDNNNYISLNIYNQSLQFKTGISGVELNAWSTAGITIPNTWYHVAFVRASGVCKFYINGIDSTLLDNITSRNLSDFAAVLKIGRYTENVGVHSDFVGYLDEVRVSKGIARWTSNFTPPTTQYPISGNMILQSNVQVATVTPISSRIVLFEEDVDSVTINTDLKAYVSRDNGTTFSQVTLEDEGNYITGARILSGVVDISAQPSGSNMKYKVETLNTKKLNLHGTAVSWK